MAMTDREKEVCNLVDRYEKRIAELESNLAAECQHAREGWENYMLTLDRLDGLEAERTCRNDKDKWSGLAKYLFVCSECGWNLVDVGNDAIDISARLMKRCPMCGAEVVGE